MCKEHCGCQRIIKIQGGVTWVHCHNAIDSLDHALLKLEDTFTTLQQEDSKAITASAASWASLSAVQHADMDITDTRTSRVTSGPSFCKAA